MHKGLTQMLKGIIHKRIHLLDKFILYLIDIRDITLS